MKDINSNFFTTGQIAEHCGVSFKTVIRWINRGYIKANRLQGRGDQYVSLDDFIDFLNENNFSSIEKRLRNGILMPKVLIVDDEINVINSLSRIFTANGFTTLSAENGFKAGFILNQEKPQLLTLDLNMKNLNGFDVLKIIKGLNLSQKVWVIIISGDSIGSLEKAIELGADFYLRKPFAKNDLEKIIQKVCPENLNYSNNKIIGNRKVA